MEQNRPRATQRPRCDGGGFNDSHRVIAFCLEFNYSLDVLFDQDDATELLRFLSTCTLRS